MFFPVSGIEVNPLIPFVVAFGVSFFTSMGGVSGAFLLLPFQMSVLGYTAPSVSGTNQVFNIVAIPSGVYRFIREGRMLWPLTWAVIAGTLPGVIFGAWVRIKYLPDPRNFKLFVGAVLLYIGARLFLDVAKNQERKKISATARNTLDRHSVKLIESNFRRVEFAYDYEHYHFSPLLVYLICFLVGIIGGIYGIGGGAIVAPFFVTIVGLPVYTVAGAALMGTFITSVAGVGIYQLYSMIYTNAAVAPDWILGALFGAGGFFGMYLGARAQKYVPARFIKGMLCACVLYVAIHYVVSFFK
ncbi:MAG: sulfite exporter TauE/SafE family protein [Desulfobacterales bacterium]|nr:sulfite exporter TauE/SafE family protein [Desulfobacterales bacterium]